MVKYYKYIDNSGNITQYEATTRTINSPNVVGITESEYTTAIAAIEAQAQAEASNE